MSEPRPPEAVKLLASLFSGDARLLDDAVRSLSETYGRADYISARLPFEYTGYYAKEFGSPLVRRFVAFERLIRPESLPDVKLRTNALERGLMAAGSRRVNIDPGYLSPAHLILATGKGFAHRPYLRDGIYADLTLIYRGGAFQPLPWTYPDYGSDEVTAMLGRIRDKYLLQLREKGQAARGAAPGDDEEPR